MLIWPTRSGAANIRRYGLEFSIQSASAFKVGVGELAVITRQLGDMFKAGIPSAVSTSYSRTIRKPGLGSCGRAGKRRSRGGSTLWQRYHSVLSFPPLYVQMVRSGELEDFWERLGAFDLIPGEGA